MRFWPKTSAKQQALDLNAAYKRILNEPDILSDLISYSGIFREDDANQSTEQMLIWEGRRQVAMRMIRHLDLDVQQMLMHHNDAEAINQAINEDINNG